MCHQRSGCARKLRDSSEKFDSLLDVAVVSPAGARHHATHLGTFSTQMEK